MPDRLERILDEGYLADLEARPTADIRVMRDECEEEESGISYARRIVQGKLDIVRAEVLRRQESGDASGDLRTLLDRLPDILGDEVTSRSQTDRSVRFLVPPAAQHHAERADRLGDEVIADIDARSDDELLELVQRIEQVEEELSTVRRELFTRIDALRSELARRYREGAADVAEVLPSG